MPKARNILILSLIIQINAIAYSDHPQREGFSYTEAIILGAVQGIAEFLPISSTGHLILTNHFLNLDTDIPAFEQDGRFIEKEGHVYTLKEAANGYTIIMQGGTILAALFVFWKNIISMLIGMLGQDPNGLKLIRNLIIAFIPAAIAGLIFKENIEAYLFDPKWVIIAIITGALLMLGVEKFKKPAYSNFSTELELHQLTAKQSLMIGLLQCISLWPGVSRSMITIVGGVWVGFSLKKAAEFSFLLGLVTLTAGSGYKMLTDGSNIMKALNFGPSITGCITAFIVGGIAIRWLVGYVTDHGLSLFAWYRLGLAVAVSLIIYT